MKEKIISLLENKFQGTRKDGLRLLAGVISITAKDEEAATALVDDLTAEQVKDFVTEYRKGADAEITKATQTAEENLRKKFSFVDKATEKTQTPDSQKNDNSNPELLELRKRLEVLEQEKIKSNRFNDLNKILVGVPESYKTEIKENFSNKTFDSDEQFSAYLKDTEQKIIAAAKEYNTRNLPTAPNYGNVDNSEVSAGMRAFVEKKQKR